MASLVSSLQAARIRYVYARICTYKHVFARIGKKKGMYSHVFVRILADGASHTRLDSMGEALLDTLQRVFPYTVKLAPRSALTRSIWCTEKVHSIVHGSRNLRAVGRSRNITCQVTESRLKGLKAKGHMTNRHQATYGWSIMKAEIRECAAQEMARQADARGAHCMYLVCSVLYSVCIRMYCVCSVILMHVLAYICSYWHVLACIL